MVEYLVSYELKNSKNYYQGVTIFIMVIGAIFLILIFYQFIFPYLEYMKNNINF